MDKVSLTTQNMNLKSANTKLGDDFEKMIGIRPVALNSTMMSAGGSQYQDSVYNGSERGSVMSTMRTGNFDSDKSDKKEAKIRELNKRINQASTYIEM